MNTFRAVIAVVVFVVFVAFGVFLVMNADTKDSTEWERLVYVFGAAEAIAFTAVGWIFGREVNRKQAESAEEAEKTAAKEQAKGAALAGMVKGAAGTPAARERLGAAEGDLAAALKFASEEYGV